MRERISRWLKSPMDRALESEVEGLTIRLQHAEAQLRALYEALDEWHNSGSDTNSDYLALPPRRDWP